MKITTELTVDGVIVTTIFSQKEKEFLFIIDKQGGVNFSVKYDVIRSKYQQEIIDLKSAGFIQTPKERVGQYIRYEISPSGKEYIDFIVKKGFHVTYEEQLKKEPEFPNPFVGIKVTKI